MLSSPSWRLVESLAWVLQSAKLIPDRNKPTSASEPAAFLRSVLMACYNSCFLQIVAFPRGGEGKRSGHGNWQETYSTHPHVPSLRLHKQQQREASLLELLGLHPMVQGTSVTLSPMVQGTPGSHGLFRDTGIYINPLVRQARLEWICFFDLLLVSDLG